MTIRVACSMHGRIPIGVACWLAYLALGAGAAPAAQAAGFAALDAVRLGLSHNPSVQLQRKQVQFSEGAALQAAAGFDTRLQAGLSQDREVELLTNRESALAPASPDPVVTDTRSGSVGLTKLMRNGVSVTPALVLEQTDDTALQSIFGDPPANRAAVSFTVSVPLMKNTGRDTLGVAERAAQTEVEATRGDLRHTVSQATVDIVTAYWTYLAAARRAEIAIEAERGVERLAGEIRKLIDAGEVPAADINVVRANLAEKRVTRTSAQQAVHDARNALARVIGLDRSAAADLPLPSDDFPEPMLSAGDGERRLASWLEQALVHRADLQAAELRNGANRVLVDGSRNTLQPQLDVALGLKWNGLAEGSSASDTFGSLHRRTYGPVVNAALLYEFPVENSAARGELAQRIATLDQGLIRTRDLRDSITTSIDSLAAALERSAAQVQSAVEAVELYRTTLANEETKRRLGYATLIDVINISDRLLVARLNETEQRLAYATAVARLRFQTGRLILPREGEPDGYDVTESSLKQLPSP